MTETLAPDIELIELLELDPNVPCDIGNHNNFQTTPCPEEAKWRVAYSCCNRSSLMCPRHKDMFVSLCLSYRHEVTRCPHCKVSGFIDDVLVVEPL